jgi:excisionase family DNA binding protein
MIAEEQTQSLLSKAEAMRLLSISLGTLNNLIRQRKLAVVRIGARVLVHPDDLKAFIESAKATTARAA